MLGLSVLIGMTACSKDSEKGLDTSASNEIRVTTTVSDRTRAGYTTENLTSFGLIIGTDDVAGNYHKEMVKNGTEWTTADAMAMYWASRSNPSTVIAYAPYRADDINHNSKIEVDVEADQTTEGAVMASDFIAMKNPAFVPDKDLTADGRIPVSMSHLFGKVILNIVFPEFYDQADQSNPISDVRVDGLKVNGILDLKAWDGTRDGAGLSIDGNGDAAEVVPYASDFDAATRTAVYEFIAVPQQASIKVSFKAAGTPYTWEYTVFEPKSGYVTTVNLTIDKQGIQTGGDVNVDLWEDGDDIDGDPTEGADPFTIKDITDKSAWSLAYGFCSMPFGKYTSMWDGNAEPGSGGVFTYIIDGMPGSPNLGNPFTVIDLGGKKWIAGAGVQVSFRDVIPKKVEFYVTDAEDLGNVITDAQRQQLMCNAEPCGDDLAKTDEFKTMLESMKNADAEVNWTKIGEVNLESMTDEWANKAYNVSVPEADLDAQPRSRYIKLVITPFGAAEASVLGGDRVQLGELFIREVTARNGVSVN